MALYFSEGCLLPHEDQGGGTLSVKSTGKNAPFKFNLMNSNGALPLVGGPCNDGKWVVSPLGCRSLFGRSTVALDHGDGLRLGIPLRV